MIAILDYRAGNLTSVERALKHLGHACEITDSHEKIRAAERIIFPGVGAAGRSMQTLKRLGLDKIIPERLAAGVPMMGICVGLQVMVDYSEEDGNTPCLGIVAGATRRFPSGMMDRAGHRLKIPHMGWNRVEFAVDHKVFRDLPETAEFYFVHGYYPDPSDPKLVAGRTQYGITFTSAIYRDNMVATQFHPEKSGAPGLKILDNFCRWDGVPY